MENGGGCLEQGGLKGRSDNNAVAERRAPGQGCKGGKERACRGQEARGSSRCVRPCVRARGAWRTEPQH